MRVNAYLFFDGRCREAFEFYERCLGARVEAMMPYAGTPMEAEVPPGSSERIMHACLELPGRGRLTASDSPPGRHEAPKGFAVALHVPDVAEAERVFAALGEGGTVTMPLTETFWAARFGMLVDRFGTPWMVNCEAGPAASG